MDETGLLITAATVIAAVILTLPAYRFAPWVGAERKDIRRALRLAGLQAGERFYDLGSGDGRVVIVAARDFGARATGVELTIPLFLASLVRRFVLRVPQAHLVQGDLFQQDVSDADVVFVYGMPKALAERVRPKLQAEMKAGSRVVAIDFPIGGWEPETVDDDPGYSKKIRMYRV